MRSSKGFSLVELLMVVAIIGLIMAMYMSTFAKVQRKAKQVVAGEAVRQHGIGRMADNANFARRPPEEPATREESRAAYRQPIRTADGDVFITRPTYSVSSTAEFKAFWNTVINPDAMGPLEYNGNRLIAEDEDGNRFELASVPEDYGIQDARFANAVVGWEFLSTRMSDTTLEGLGANVLYGDGRIEYVRYPGPFPVNETVAKLSRRFLQESS